MAAVISAVSNWAAHTKAGSSSEALPVVGIVRLLRKAGHACHFVAGASNNAAANSVPTPVVLGIPKTF